MTVKAAASLSSTMPCVSDDGKKTVRLARNLEQVLPRYTWQNPSVAPCPAVTKNAISFLAFKIRWDQRNTEALRDTHVWDQMGAWR